MFYLTGGGLSSVYQGLLSRFFSLLDNCKWFLLSLDKRLVHKRISDKVVFMLRNGLVEESICLNGILPRGHRLLSTMGYYESILFHYGFIGCNRVINSIIKKQYGYFKSQVLWSEHELWWEKLFFNNFGDIIKFLERLH